MGGNGMANLYVIKQKATPEILIDIWCDYCKSDIEKRKKDIAAYEQEFKKNSHEIIDQAMGEAISEGQKGCLMNGALRAIFGVITGVVVVGGDDHMSESMVIRAQAKKIHEILSRYDLRNALVQFREQKVEIPPELAPGLRDFVKKDVVLLYWEKVQMIANQIEQKLAEMQDKKDQFAQTYYSLQGSTIDTQTLLMALFGAAKLLDIDPGNLPNQINSLIENGGYVDFSLKNYIGEWMNTYKTTVLNKANDA